jgi:gliding motility-associated-like protein
LTYYNAAFGCQDIDTVNITIRECDALRLPNAFAPNSNVPEDQTYHILNPGDFYRLVRMEIYNRWGQLVFATNDKNSKGWDGKFRGTDQEMGTYIYNVVAECGGGRVINLKGDVTLLR